MKEQCGPSVAAKSNVGYAAAVLKAISSTNATVARGDIVSMADIYKKDPRSQQKKTTQKVSEEYIEIKTSFGMKTLTVAL